MKQLVTLIALVFSTVFVQAQKRQLTFTESSIGVKKKINKTVKVFENEELSSVVKALKIPAKIKTELEKDIQKKYDKTKPYSFRKQTKETSYVVRIEEPYKKATRKIDLYGMGSCWPSIQNDIAYLGVGLNPFDFKQSKTMKSIRGVQVESLVEGEAAYNAGLEIGDVITAINGKKTPSTSLLKSEVTKLKPRDEVAFTFYRKGKKMTAKAMAGAKSSSQFPSQIEQYDISKQLDKKMLDKLMSDITPQVEELGKNLEPKLLKLGETLEPQLKDLTKDLQNNLKDLLPQLEKLTEDLRKQIEQQEKKSSFKKKS